MAAALPDRYGVSASAESNVVTNNFVVSIGMIAGACGVGVMGSSIVVKTGEFYNFANYFLEVLDQTQFVVYAGIGALVLGFIGIVTGAVLACSGLFVSKFPKCVFLGFALLLGSAAANIAAGAIVQSGIALLNDAIYNQPSQAVPQATTVNATFTQNVTHFQLAMFNGCCASQGLDYSKEVYNPIPEPVFGASDPSGYVKFCGAIFASNYQDLVNQNRRSCFRDQEIYRQYNFTVTNNLPRICQTLTDARVNVAGKDVPGMSISVTTITGGKNIIPIVAPHEDPNYGCGAGYAKAFQAAMLIWAENVLSPLSMAFLVCGAIYIVLFVLGAVSVYSCSQNRESAEEKYAKYLEELHNSSQAASKGQVTDAFEQPNPNRMSYQAQGDYAGNRMSYQQPPQGGDYAGNRMSVSNSNRMSVQSYATHGSQPQRQELPFNVDDKI